MSVSVPWIAVFVGDIPENLFQTFSQIIPSRCFLFSRLNHEESTISIGSMYSLLYEIITKTKTHSLRRRNLYFTVFNIVHAKSNALDGNILTFWFWKRFPEISYLFRNRYWNSFPNFQIFLTVHYSQTEKGPQWTMWSFVRPSTKIPLFIAIRHSSYLYLKRAQVFSCHW